MEPQVADALNKREELNKLNLKLDDLFERYLELLDQYQAIRKQLSTELSSGFFSLAQANFCLNSGRRYGQDYYDERMQATRRANITEAQNGYEQVTITNSEDIVSSKEEAEDGSESDHQDAEDSETEKSATKSRDPITWYGILLPPALRSAQAQFISAIEGSIPRITMLSKELRNMEIEIGRTRKAMNKLEKA